MGGDVESEENLDREPRIHVIADLSNETFSLHLSQCSVELYDLPCFSARREANLLYTTVAMVPMLLQLKKLVGRRIRVLFHVFAVRMPSFSLTHSSDSTEL